MEHIGYSWSEGLRASIQWPMANYWERDEPWWCACVSFAFQRVNATMQYVTLGSGVWRGAVMTCRTVCTVVVCVDAHQINTYGITLWSGGYVIHSFVPPTNSPYIFLIMLHSSQGRRVGSRIYGISTSWYDIRAPSNSRHIHVYVVVYW